MPYISPDRREEIHEELYDDALNWVPQGAGDLNFVISCFVDNYLQDDVRYSRINEMIGALECAKLELYRLIAAPYEEEKMAENGKVYQCLDSNNNNY